MNVPGRAGSISSIDEDDDTDYDYASNATPRNTSYFPPIYDTARRVSDLRSTPQGALTPLSPEPSTAPNTGSSGQGRGARPRINTLKGESGEGPPRMPAVSRSASRVRLNPAKDKDKDKAKDKDLEDDEVQVLDRGEDLIRRRIKQRKRAKRERERERRLAAEAAEAAESEFDPLDEPSSAPTSGGQETGFTVQSRAAAMSPVRGGSQQPTQRASSRQRAASSTRGPSSGTSYPSQRSGSITSIDRADSLLHVPLESSVDDLGEDQVPEDEAEEELQLDDDQSQHDEDEDEDEDEDGSNEDDEGVTVKDRQDVSIRQKRGAVSSPRVELPADTPTGYQPRAPFRSAHLEARSVPQVAFRDAQCRVGPARKAVGGRRASPSSRQYSVDSAVRLVAVARVLCRCPRCLGWRVPRRCVPTHRLRQDAHGTGMVHCLAVWQVRGGRRRA